MIFVILSIPWYPYLRKKKNAADFRNFSPHFSQKTEFSFKSLPNIALVMRLCTSLKASHFTALLRILSGSCFAECIPNCFIVCLSHTFASVSQNSKDALVLKSFPATGM
jgi:hypothetical protein